MALPTKALTTRPCFLARHVCVVGDVLIVLVVIVADLVVVLVLVCCS